MCSHSCFCFSQLSSFILFLLKIMLQNMKILYLCTLSCLIYLECCSCRKDLKFVSDIEKEMRMLVEAVNKVSIQIFCMT